MNPIRLIAIRSLLVLAATVLQLTMPAAVPWTLLLAISFMMNDGPLSSTFRWVIGWLLFTEAASSSAFGTLTFPFCLAALLLIAARRFIAFAPWSERVGWSLADVLRTSVITVVACILAWGGWVLAGALEGAPQLLGRFHSLISVIPLLLAAPPLMVMSVRASTEPFRRPIMFSAS